MSLQTSIWLGAVGEFPVNMNIMVYGAILLRLPFPFSQSCIIKRYCEKRFVPKYLATIGIDYGVTK